MNIKHTAMSLIAAATIGGFALAPQAANAQRWDRDNDRVYRPDWTRDRNDRNRNDWNRGRESRVHVQRLINDLERSSNTFRSAVERSRIDDRSWNSRYGRDDRYRRDHDWRGHDDFKRMVQRMDESIENLRRDYDRNDYRRDTRSQLSEVMRHARIVDRVMDSRRYPNSVEILWRRVAGDLNALSNAFDMGRF